MGPLAVTETGPDAVNMDAPGAPGAPGVPTPSDPSLPAGPCAPCGPWDPWGPCGPGTAFAFFFFLAVCAAGVADGPLLLSGPDTASAVPPIATTRARSPTACLRIGSITR